jgi:hypothetical protein
MTNRWDQLGLPHRGWSCIDVIDLAADGSIDESEYETCEMCGNEKIRYVHVMTHSLVETTVRVGCVCSGNMSGDYVGPKQREKRLRSRATRKTRWLTRTWRVSTKGNEFINVDGSNLGVHAKGTRWGYRIDSEFSTKTYATSDEAKLALFDAFWLQENS